MPIIQVNTVSKRYILQHDRPKSFQDLALGLVRRNKVKKSEDFWALERVSFNIERGEAVGLIGRNGSGKSTCMKIMAGIVKPTSGSISIDGRVSALIELGAGFHPELTGKDNVLVNGVILGMTRKDIQRQFDTIVAFAEMEHFIDIPVKFYSSGMYLRLAFAIAINVNANILLLDEILAVGDQAFQHKCLERIKHLQEQGTTIVFVSHDLNAVKAICKRAIWLEDGHIKADGGSDEVTQLYSDASKD